MAKTIKLAERKIKKLDLPEQLAIRKWSYFLLIPASAIFLGILWSLVLGGDNPIREVLINIFIGIFNTSVIWLGCMAIVSFLWYKFPWEQKAMAHLLIEIPAIIGYTILVGMLLFFLQKKLQIMDTSDINMSVDIAISILITLLITTIHEAYFFYKQWKLNFSKSIKLEKENIHAKYETLKAQINPHFLFNSLNSLVTLIDGNDKATNYIMDLSDFLRYMLKSREREVVLLREEVNILNKYINLQQARFGNNLQFKVNIKEKFYHFALPPLVLQMLVENCIKHNVISKSKPLIVDIYIDNGFIKVENNLQIKNDAYSTGNGIRNISQRYAYLTEKKVEINQTNDKFTVAVPIVLVDL